ncbi:SCO family protein [Agrobacterium tumefaciens]|uniref:SCO family protein n=1 Tax=Agrobacterium tumefaciens TaxID=358 RepID=UPI0015725409|nr:SCO family protein [Agrobacterium tumefaciens]NTD11699.1 SCO family protein [Agrobacterium tumefaciens]
MKRLRIFQIALWCLVVIVGAGLLVFGEVLPLRPNVEATDRSTPVIGKPFELVSHNGQVINNTVLKGKPYLAFFGFTHCPDICPTTLFELTDLMNELGPLADRFNVAFISVDPERDTQDMLKEYMTAFDSRIMALRGSPHQTEVALKAFAAYAKRVPTEGGNYTMDHTAGVYLMDANGAFKGTLDMHEPRETRLHKIRNLVAGMS